MISAQIETAVSSGVRAPQVEPDRRHEAVEVGRVGDALLRQPLEPLVVVRRPITPR
jgi:hypothetical protein